MRTTTATTRYFKATATQWGPGKVHLGLYNTYFQTWVAHCQFKGDPARGDIASWPGKILPEREFTLTCKNCLNIEKKAAVAQQHAEQERALDPWRLLTSYVQQRLFEIQPTSFTTYQGAVVSLTKRDYIRFRTLAVRLVGRWTAEHDDRPPVDLHDIRYITHLIIADRIHEIQERKKERHVNDGLRRFDAHFDSSCQRCSATICEGDQIARTPEGDYICEDCIQGWEED